MGERRFLAGAAFLLQRQEPLHHEKELQMTCPSCGAENADSAAFCAKCGAKLVTSAPNSSEASPLPERPCPRPILPVARQTESFTDEKTVPFWNRTFLKKLGKWIPIGLVAALFLWWAYIPMSVIWAYASPDLNDDALWSFGGRRANGVRTMGHILGDEPRVLMTVKHYEGLAKDYYFVAWDEDFENFVVVRCDETTFQQIKSEKSFRLKGVVRTLHKEIAEKFKRYRDDLSWSPTMVLPGKCIDMTGMKSVGCLFLALLALSVPWFCTAGYRFWKKTSEERRTARHCANCGIRLERNAKFCISCGTTAPVESSREPTDEENRRGADDWNSLPKPLQYLLVAIAVLGGLLIYFVFYQRYWEIEWMTLR